MLSNSTQVLRHLKRSNSLTLSDSAQDEIAASTTSAGPGRISPANPGPSHDRSAASSNRKGVESQQKGKDHAEAATPVAAAWGSASSAARSVLHSTTESKESKESKESHNGDFSGSDGDDEFGDEQMNPKFIARSDFNKLSRDDSRESFPALSRDASLAEVDGASGPNPQIEASNISTGAPRVPPPGHRSLHRTSKAASMHRTGTVLLRRPTIDAISDASNKNLKRTKLQPSKFVDWNRPSMENLGRGLSAGRDRGGGNAAAATDDDEGGESSSSLSDSDLDSDCDGLQQTISIFENSDDFDQLFDDNSNPSPRMSQRASSAGSRGGANNNSSPKDGSSSSPNADEFDVRNIIKQMIGDSQNYDARLGVICGCGTTIGKRSTNEDIFDVRLNEAVSTSTEHATAPSGKRNLPYSYFAVYDGHGGIQCAEYLREHLHSKLAARVGDEAEIEFFDDDAETFQASANLPDGTSANLDHHRSASRVDAARNSESKLEDAKVSVAEAKTSDGDDRTGNIAESIAESKTADKIMDSSKLASIAPMDSSLAAIWAKSFAPTFEAIDLEFCLHARADKLPGTTGATAAAVVMCHSKCDATDSDNCLFAVVANVGDSMVLLSRRGRAAVLSTAHTVATEAQRLVRCARLISLSFSIRFLFFGFIQIL